MDIDAYIASGVLENYCLGVCSVEENSEIESNAVRYPAIRNEIDRIRQSLETYFRETEIMPSPEVKISLMRSVYKLNAEKDQSFPPLIDEKETANLMANWIAGKNFPVPDTDFDNLYMIDLPSTGQVTNFIVHAKVGHDEEMHDDFIEYLYLIKGSCIMDFNGEKRSYKEGELISIKPNIRHYAKVTSSEPMIALVQRQACA